MYCNNIIRLYSKGARFSTIRGFSSKLHSEDYFGEQRDFWWNRDFLKLMATRWSLNKVFSVLDVGCGVGHWGRELALVLPHNARVVGIDSEQKWVETATKLASMHILDDRYTYQKADAVNIPFSDNMFDMVTCQTLLIHLKNPQNALKEFIRVLKPGGLIAVVEPNNLAMSVTLSNAQSSLSVEVIIRSVEFQLICERGKQVLGEGNISIGETIPSYLMNMPVEDLKVFLSDKCTTFIPPYNTKEQSVTIQQMLENCQNNFWIWDQETTKRYFTAGILHERPSLNQMEINEHFNQNWMLVRHMQDLTSKAIKEKTLATSGGNALYLISARKKLKI